MSLEAVQAQAGHASIDSTRIYLHSRTTGCRASILRAAEAIEAQIDPTRPEERRHSEPGLRATPQVEALVDAYRVGSDGGRSFR